MRFIDCAFPGCTHFLFDGGQTETPWYCKDHAYERREFVFPRVDPEADLLVEGFMRRRAPVKTQSRSIPKVYDPGFDRPEDGSRLRYIDRRKVRSWGAHTLWWVLHNAVAHPLIAFLPFTPLFRFHDWTSRRMHGL